MTTSDKDQKNPPVIVSKKSLLMLEKSNDKNQQFMGRATPHIQAKSLDYLKTLGKDSEGVPFAEYDISAIEMQAGDTFVCTLINIPERTVNHVAVCDGVYVVYVFTRNGHLVHRIAATDSVIRGVKRAQQKAPVEHAAAAGLFTTYSAHGMTMEEAIAITSASSNEEIVKAMEKWVADHGGMDRILEKNLSDALFDKPVMRPGFNSRRLHLLTMKEGEYGPLPPHPGMVKKQAESLFNMAQPEIEEGEVITQSRVMLETGMVLHLVKRKDGWPTVYCCDKDGNLLNIVRLGVSATLEDWFTLNDRFCDDRGFMNPQRIPEGMTLVELQSEHHRLLMPQGEPAESACSPITQDVITPKGVSQVWKADLEAAKRLAEVIIRPNKDGLEINYGRLALGHLEGIPFLAEVEDIEKAELRCIYISRIPKFQQHLKLLVSWLDEEAAKLHPNVMHDREVTVYVLEKEDLAQLGAILSKNGRYARAVYRGCFLQTWSNGFIYAPYRPATDFFDNLTEEEIEEAKF